MSTTNVSFPLVLGESIIYTSFGIFCNLELFVKGEANKSPCSIENSEDKLKLFWLGCLGW